MIDELDLRETLSRRAALVPATSSDATRAVRRARRRLIRNSAVAAVAGLAVVASAFAGVRTIRTAPTPAHHPTPSVRPSPTGVPDAGAPSRAIYGLPPDDAIPSRPEVGELVVSFGRFCCPMHDLMVYADGRVISRIQTLDEATDTGGWLEQRLTAEGIEHLRSELISSGLFGHDRSFVKRTVELAIVVRGADGRLVTLEASTAEDPFGASTEQAASIARLAALLADLETSLPADAWADRATHAYIPARYVVKLDFAGVGNVTPDASELPPAAATLLRQADQVDRYSSCQIVTTAEARTISERLRVAEGLSVWKAPRESRNGPVAFSIGGGTAPAGTMGIKGFVYLRPLLPDQTTC